MSYLEKCIGMKKSWNLDYKLNKTIKKEWLKQFDIWWNEPPAGKPKDYPKTTWLKFMKIPINDGDMNLMFVIERGMQNLFREEIEDSGLELKIETRHIKKWLETNGDGVIYDKDYINKHVVEFCIRGYEGAILVV